MDTGPQPIFPPLPPLPPNYLTDRQWVQDHSTELVNQYPDQWVAVLNGSVIASGQSRGQSIEAAQRSHPGTIPYLCLIERHPRVYTG